MTKNSRGQFKEDGESVSCWLVIWREFIELSLSFHLKVVTKNNASNARLTRLIPGAVSTRQVCFAMLSRYILLMMARIVARGTLFTVSIFFKSPLRASKCSHDKNEAKNNKLTKITVQRLLPRALKFTRCYQLHKYNL